MRVRRMRERAKSWDKRWCRPILYGTLKVRAPKSKQTNCLIKKRVETHSLPQMENRVENDSVLTYRISRTREDWEGRDPMRLTMRERGSAVIEGDPQSATKWPAKRSEAGNLGRVHPRSPDTAGSTPPGSQPTGGGAGS